MAKAGLSNSLIGKRITPKPEYGTIPADATGININEKIWVAMKPNLSHQYTAEIVAAWTDNGTVKVSAVDPFGNIDEFFLKNVNLKVE